MHSRTQKGLPIEDRSRETRLCLVNVRLVGKWEVIRSFLFARRLEIANRLPQADEDTLRGGSAELIRATEAFFVTERSSPTAFSCSNVGWSDFGPTNNQSSGLIAACVESHCSAHSTAVCIFPTLASIMGHVRSR